MKNMFFFFLENKRRNIFSFFPWKQKEKNGFRIRSFIHDLRWENWLMKQESKSESNRNLFFFYQFQYSNTASLGQSLNWIVIQPKQMPLVICRIENFIKFSYEANLLKFSSFPFFDTPWVDKLPYLFNVSNFCGACCILEYVTLGYLAHLTARAQTKPLTWETFTSHCKDRLN